MFIFIIFNQIELPGVWCNMFRLFLLKLYRRGLWDCITRIAFEYPLCLCLCFFKSHLRKRVNLLRLIVSRHKVLPMLFLATIIPLRLHTTDLLPYSILSKEYIRKAYNTLLPLPYIYLYMLMLCFAFFIPLFPLLHRTVWWFWYQNRDS